ncbi:MAG: metallophosphoesterase [Opitutus sp.]|nr:metallophosphoesterase [Opitutus sp.]
MRRIAHISDLHFGTERAELAIALRAELEEFAPDLVIVSGDLTQRARTSQFRAAAEYLATLPQPQIVVPGNHDIPLYDVARRFLAPLARYRRWIAENTDPVFEDEEIFVAALNSARSLTWKSGRISDEQIERLRLGLRARKAATTIVVTHHPFIPPPLADSTDAKIDLVGRAERALSVLDDGEVDLLLAGHLHHSYSGDTRTQYPAARRAIVSGQAGTAISRRVRSGQPNGYNRIVTHPDQITVEVRAWAGERFAPAASVAYARHAEGWLIERAT